MLTFAYGFIFTAFIVISLTFLKYWRKTGDRFFMIFAVSFFLLAVERLCIALLALQDTEASAPIYLIRLLSFGLIITAILDKNRAAENTTEKDKSLNQFVN